MLWMTKFVIEAIPASGLTYCLQEGIIERVASIKANQYRRIGFYDLEDLKQEIRIKCWSVISRYDAQCGANLYVFLSVCADNRLRDIKRGVMYKHNKPCLRCPFWHAGAAASGIHDCLVYDYKMDCERFNKHEKYVQAKLSASHPIDINNEKIADSFSSMHELKLDLVDYVEVHLSKSLLPLFMKLKTNNYNLKCLKPKERNIILCNLKDILKDFVH